MQNQYPNLSRVIEGFLLHKTASGLSPNTLRNYKNQLRRFQDWTKNPPINEISPRNLEEFFQFLQKEFQITHVCGITPITPRKLSPKTVNNAWGSLSVFWRWTTREFDIENPLRVKPPKAHIKPISPITMEEVEKLLKACEFAQEREPYNRCAYRSSRPTKKRDKALILTLLDTGIRVSELCGIDVGDLDLNSGRILVTGKGKKSRYVYLGKLSRRAIWKYLAERFPKEKPKQDEPLYVDQWGLRRLSGNSIRLLINRLGIKVGIENVHPHRFRHTFAIQFLRNSGDVFTLQQLLGHSSLDMVRKYLQIAQLDLENAQRKASPVDNWRLR